MAKIKQGILGGFSGSVAGVVGTSWKGRAVMKAKPLSVANPRTDGQVSQRTSFAAVAKIASEVLSQAIRPVMNPIAGNVSGYNKFTSINKQLFSGNGTFTPANGKFGGGTLSAETITAMTVTDTSGIIKMDWNSIIPQGEVRADDEIYCFAYEPTTETIFLPFVNAKRYIDTVNLAKFKGGSEMMGQLQVTAFVAFVSPDGRLVSTASNAQTFTCDFGS